MLNEKLSVFFFLLLACIYMPLSTNAQNQNLRSSIADLTQDFKLIDRQIKSLALEVEILRNKDEGLPDQSNYSDLKAEIDQLKIEMQNIRQLISDQESKIKETVSENISKEIEAYFVELKSSLKSVDMEIVPKEENENLKEFSDVYPKTGISYEVQSGDTLSQIALKYGSRVSYIQNANLIANPSKDLQVGDIIFIPLEED